MAENGTIDMRDTQNNLRELQFYLRGISYFDPAIPRIPTDGIASAQTEEAIRIFQKQQGIAPQAPNADYLTWEAARNQYYAYLASILVGDSFTALYNPAVLQNLYAYPMLVSQVQFALSVIRGRIRTIPDIVINGKLSPEFTTGISAVQKVYLLPVTGTLDKATYNAIVNAYNAVMRLSQSASSDGNSVPAT